MRDADTILSIHRSRGENRLPLERVYRHLFNPEFYQFAYGKTYRNAGAMTRGTNSETVDGMSSAKIANIIDLLKQEKWCWSPVRRVLIPKANGKTRPLGIPTWSDKLLQEVLRALLDAYYEPQFSDHSHGFRPRKGCHSALREIKKGWLGTVWFIEGDIKGCFDNIDHTVLLEILKRDIHDGRLVNLIHGLLKAGYMEAWKKEDTLSGTPQGGILSPLLANIYLNELDKFVENELIPAYTRGAKRKVNREYSKQSNAIGHLRRTGRAEEASVLKQQIRSLPSLDPFDPDYRRLKYVRYADDFLLGFIGPKEEAEAIRLKIQTFLKEKLNLELSAEKTLITHAGTDQAKFLGHEISIARANDRVTGARKKRATNGKVALSTPRSVVTKIQQSHSRGGKVCHRNELLVDSDYTIVQRYQSVLKGLYNFYCMTQNVGKRLATVKWILETSLVKTLACKHKTTVPNIYRKYGTTIEGCKALQVVIERPDRPPLVATFGGFGLQRQPDGVGTDWTDFDFRITWHYYGGPRSEAVERLTSTRCNVCGADGPTEMHHIRKLSDINRPGRRPSNTTERIMTARKRKSIPVCKPCHDNIHAGKHDGPRVR